MTITNKTWIGLAVALVAGIYIYVYAGWFKPAQVQIFHRLTAGRQFRGRQHLQTVAPELTVVFGLEQKLKLTEVKVVPLVAGETNKEALAVWHLVSKSNSVPVKGFLYGDHIRGMEPYVNGTRPHPLETNVTYRLTVRAGSAEGQHDFSLSGVQSDDPEP